MFNYATLPEATPASARSSHAAQRTIFPVAGFMETFMRHLRDDPRRAACYAVTLSGDQLDAQSFSFRDLAERARRTWRNLEAHGLQRGDRVLLCVGRPDRLLVGMLACWAGGFVPVPLPAIGDFKVPTLFLERVTSVAADCSPRLLVVDSVARWERVRKDAPAIPVTDPDTLESAAGAAAKGELPPHAAGDVAFIQYTSGSTGRPRGVVVTHENLAANVKAIGVVTDVTAGDCMVSWLPLHHDMGLVGGMLFPIYARIPTYIMQPVTFVMRPSSWLRALSQFRGTYSVAPNFAYSLCARRVPERDLKGLDLSSWRLAFNGAEPIDAEMVRSFIRRYGAYGFRATSFYPVYGLAEATLAVAFPPPGSEPVVDTISRSALVSQGVARPAPGPSTDSVSFVSVGAALSDHRIEIQDPDTRRPLLERQVGEIVAYGPSISPRYFGDSEDECRSCLRTGDLGYVADGRLYVIDRLKDLIIVAGQNFSPADIETCAARVAGMRRGRIVAFSTMGEDATEQVHIVGELDPRSLRRQEAIGAEISTRIQEDLGLGVQDVRLIPPGTLPRTTSGKIQRKACRTMYLEGQIPPALGMRTRLDIWLRWKTRWVAALGTRN